MKKVGIIGGTFNPIHVGHLMLAERAYDEFALDEILFIPAGLSYFKDQAIVLDKKDRIAMTSEAIGDNSHFALSTIECDRIGNSYTYETLEELKKKNPQTQYYLILGADSLVQMELWQKPQIIFQDAIILAAKREGPQPTEFLQKVEELKEKYHADIRILPCTYMDISSSEIRQRIKERKSIRYLVVPAVEHYIKKHHLYEAEDKIHGKI